LAHILVVFNFEQIYNNDDDDVFVNDNKCSAVAEMGDCLATIDMG